MWGLWEFIVSGRVPGTLIQVSFEHWLYTIIGLSAVTVLIIMIRSGAFMRLRLLTLGWYAAYVISTDSRKLTGEV
jgi:hypothetical protein